MSIRFFLLFVLGFVLCANTFASANDNASLTNGKRLTVSEDDNSSAYLHQDVNANLLSRVEILERTIVRLQDEIGQLKSKDNPTQQIISNHDTSGQDVFDTTNVNSSEASVTHSKSLANKSTKNDDANAEKRAYDLALVALKDNKFKEAEEQFADFLKNYHKSTLQSNVYFWYGETFFKRNLFDQAAINYLKGYKQFPKGVKASDSLLKLALCLGELNKKKDACSMLSRLETEFPNRSVSSIKRAKDAKMSFGCK